MSDVSAEWQPQEPPAGLAFTRSSSLGWRHNIPGSKHRCRKRAGSGGATQTVSPSSTNAIATPQTESKAVASDRAAASDGEKDQVRPRTPPVDSIQDANTSTETPLGPQLQRARSSSLKETRTGSAGSTSGRGPGRAARVSTKRSKSHNDIEMPEGVPRVPSIPAAILLADRTVTAEKIKAVPRRGHEHGLPRRQTSTRSTDPTRLQQREAPRYAAAMANPHLLPVLPGSQSSSKRASAITSVSDAASSLSVITTFKLRTPADSPDTPQSPSPWDTTGPHERFVDGIEFEMLEVPSTQPARPIVSIDSPIVQSPVSISPAMQPRTATTPRVASPKSSAKPIPPSTMLADITSTNLLAPKPGGLSSRASSVLLPESMMPGIGRRLSEASTGSRTTIMINGAKIIIPKLPPPPPPKTPGPAMTFTPDLSDRAARASRRLTRTKSYSALPPSCPKGTLPRPVSKYNPATPIDFSSLGEDVPPVPAVPSTLHTPNSSVSSTSSSSSAPMIMSTLNKISMSASGDSPTGRQSSKSPPLRPGPPPVRPPPPPPPGITGLGISDVPVIKFPVKSQKPALATVPIMRAPSVSNSLKRQSSGTDKDGRKPTDVVKKRDSGIKKKDTGPLSRSKSEARRDMVKKMALDNIGAVKIREPSRSPQKPRKKDEVTIQSRLTPRPSPRPSQETQIPHSRKSMLRIQADEQDKISSLSVELRLLEARCSEAKRHHEALYVARQRLFDDFPDDNKSVSSVYLDDESVSNGSGPLTPGKEEALADIEDKIRKWRREMQQNEHKRNRIKKKLAWHSTDRLNVAPVAHRRTPSPQRYQVKTPRVVTPTSAKSFLTDYVTSADMCATPPLPTPKDVRPTTIPDKMPDLDDGRRPSIDSAASLITPPASPLTRSNEPWIGLESPFTPFLDTPAREESMVSALNVRHDGSRETLRSPAGEVAASNLRSPEPRSDRQMTIQVFAESGLTDLVASLQKEIDHLSRRVRI